MEAYCAGSSSAMGGPSAPQWIASQLPKPRLLLPPPFFFLLVLAPCCLPALPASALGSGAAAVPPPAPTDTFITAGSRDTAPLLELPPGELPPAAAAAVGAGVCRWGCQPRTIHCCTTHLVQASGGVAVCSVLVPGRGSMGECG